MIKKVLAFLLFSVFSFAGAYIGVSYNIYAGFSIVIIAGYFLFFVLVYSKSKKSDDGIYIDIDNKISVISEKINSLNSTLKIPDSTFDAIEVNDNVKNEKDIIFNVIKKLEILDKQLESIVIKTKDEVCEINELEDIEKEYSIEIKELLVRGHFLSDIYSDFLSQVYDNIVDASDPLSSGVLQIKRGVNDFLDKINHWYTEFKNDSSRKNFDNILKILNNQTVHYEKMVQIINSNIKSIKNDFIDVSSMISRIDDNTKHIEDIAAKIHTLSFNTAIEAARAGESGKGFKIIAGETKKLSDMTQDFLKKIVTDVKQTKDKLEGVSNNQTLLSNEVASNLDKQKVEFDDFKIILSDYKDDFEMIFDTVQYVKDNIYSQIDLISPTFQLHDLMSQQVKNLQVILQNYNESHKDEMKLTEEFKIEDDERKTIIKDQIDYMYKLITTDDEIQVIRKFADLYGLDSSFEIKTGNSDIELF